MEPSWIITRAAEDALPLVSSLSARGIRALALPCIEREPLPWPEWPAGDAGDATLLLFITSLAAARGLHEWWKAHADAKKAVAALSPRTDSFITSQGISVAVTSTEGSVGLAKAVVAWAKKRAGALRVLYPSSDAGELQAEQVEAVELLSQVATVDRATVYRTRAPEHLRDAMAAVPSGPTRWFFASPSAVKAAVPALQSAKVTPGVDVLCLGQSTLKAWKSAALAHWPAGRLHSRDVALVDALSQPLEPTP